MCSNLESKEIIFTKELRINDLIVALPNIHRYVKKKLKYN